MFKHKVIVPLNLLLINQVFFLGLEVALMNQVLHWHGKAYDNKLEYLKLLQETQAILDYTDKSLLPEKLSTAIQFRIMAELAELTPEDIAKGKDNGE